MILGGEIFEAVDGEVDVSGEERLVELATEDAHADLRDRAIGNDLAARLDDHDLDVDVRVRIERL